ncbi:hypothetical protein E3P99_01229 [Wallemia hederae]|uniref:Uncharacterized protein n=1 Tax=Wallemia hederae TaxID=1540922 RepID=A0A4T0FTT4_9BASI|nr:hypothetical protein E3P99_01229 [Wallemia hederae]
MSEPARRDFLDQARSTMKPDSQKTYTESAGDNLKGMSDNIASKMQPESDKSTTQQAHDTMTEGADSGRRDSFLDKIKSAMQK